MGKRSKRKRSVESVKRRSKTRRLRKKITLDKKILLPEICGEEVSSDSSVTVNSKSIGDQTESETLSCQSYKAASETASSTDIVQSEPELGHHVQTHRCGTKSSTHKHARTLHHLLINSKTDPLVVGLSMLNRIEMTKVMLSQNTSMFRDPQSRNKPF